MSYTQKNVLECTDVYKLGHLQQYPEGTEYVYSYLQARTANKMLEKTVFFGLQYYLEHYLAKPITKADVEDLLDIREQILGPTPLEVREKLTALAELGYWPLKIEAVPEGEVMPVQNVLMTIENTVPGFGWCVGYMESLLLKVWNTITVASYSLRLRELVTAYARETCDDVTHLPFQVHDFGYRGVSSEETAEVSGAAHLLNFFGTDTVPAIGFLQKWYGAEFPIGLSVPASEHSVMCSFTEKHEIEAFKHMLDTYPSGIVSIVSDTYDLWRVLTQYALELRSRILERDGKVVFRPDSGDPEKIICGNPDAPEGTPERLGALELLGTVFGYTTNSLGYRVLNPKVGLIYGDGFFFDRFETVLRRMERQGWASSNLVVGIGGLLLQAHSRDELGFAIKATSVTIDSERIDVVKNPVTDRKKRSHKGILSLKKSGSTPPYTYETIDECEVGEPTYLEPVFENGLLLRYQTLADIRERVSATTGLPRLELP